MPVNVAGGLIEHSSMLVTDKDARDAQFKD